MDTDIKYLLSLGSIRDRAKLVGEAAQAGKLSHFDIDEDKLGSAAEFVTSVIKVSHHTRSFCVGKDGLDNKINSVTTVLTNSTQSHLMVDGSILRSATCLALLT
jgi:hypothetical protein